MTPYMNHLRTGHNNFSRMAKALGSNCQIKEYTENPKGNCEAKHTCKMDCRDLVKPECTTSRKQICSTIKKEKCSVISKTECHYKTIQTRSKRTIGKFLEAKKNLIQRLLSVFGKKDAKLPKVPQRQCQVVDKKVCTFEPEEVCISQPIERCTTKTSKECMNKCEKTWICTECTDEVQPTTTTMTTTKDPITTPTPITRITSKPKKLLLQQLQGHKVQL